MSTRRLPAPFGKLIDRRHTVSFTFEKQTYVGLHGDTIASALAANDQWVLSRSFKYHRPRGLFSAAGLEANSLMQVGSEPNVYADKHPITAGLTAWGVNTFGGVNADKGRILEKFSRFMPVGFYYRTFYTPRIAWKFWGPVIRHLAGLGSVDPKTPHGHYDKAYLFPDVAVIGGGLAGLSAAITAAESGAEVLIVDDNPILGGLLNVARLDDRGEQAEAEVQRLTTHIAALPNVTILTNAVAQGLFSDRWLSVTQDHRLYKVRAKSVIIATGAHEHPAVFRGNDLPGIMLGTAAQRLMRLWGIKPGKRAVLLAANADAYGVALDLLDAGVEVAAIADLRSQAETDPRAALVRSKGVDIHTGTTIAEAVEGKNHVNAVRLAPVTGPNAFGAPGSAIACDLVCLSVGYIPQTQLLAQAGAKLLPDEKSSKPRILGLPDGIFAAGAVTSLWSISDILAQSRHVAAQAAAHAGLSPQMPDAAPACTSSLPHADAVFPHPDGKDFIEFDEDLQVRDIINAAAMGWDHIQLLKRFSTAGMGPSQGKMFNVQVQQVLARATGTLPPVIGTTTVRPPVIGEKMAQLAGRSFEPVRHTPMHSRHLAAGAKMMTAGLWMRPAYYGDDADTAIRAEVAAARTAIGMVDVSTLGGLDIRGPDAVKFLERIYTWVYDKVAVGKLRYAVMLDETGAIIDDGVACRLHQNHFYVTATTGGVDRVYRLMQFFNAQWRMKVDIANVTAAYAGINLIGPKSRQVLTAIGTDIDLSPDAFPYLSIRTGTVAGVTARVLRVGFGGELGYELHVPASQAAAIWDQLIQAGQPLGLKPVGIEAQRILRLEKGHIIVGQDTDGLTHPAEAAMSWAVGKKKIDFIGKAAMDALQARPQTRRLIGFELVNPSGPAPKENHLVIENGQIAGRVTSVAQSPTLGKVIGLAYVPPAQAAAGQTFAVRVDGGVMINAKVVPIPFYDPENKRQEM